MSIETNSCGVPSAFDGNEGLDASGNHQGKVSIRGTNTPTKRTASCRRLTQFSTWWNVVVYDLPIERPTTKLESVAHFASPNERLLVITAVCTLQEALSRRNGLPAFSPMGLAACGCAKSHTEQRMIESIGKKLCRVICCELVHCRTFGIWVDQEQPRD